MLTSARARLRRSTLTLGAMTALLLSSAIPATAADPLVLIAGTDQEFSGLNPWNATYVVDWEVYTLNYDTLVTWDSDLKPTGGFAESWTISDDGLTTTFKIRPGLKWSDGTAATSEDARFTYQLVLDAAASEKGYLGEGWVDGYNVAAGVTEVSAPDPETLVVKTDAPSPLLITNGYVPILPKHIWGGMTLEEVDAFANDPPVVGSGPYQAVEFTSGDKVRFVRNENYWGPQGAADEVIIQHFENADTAVQALKRGEIDYIRGLAADAFDALKNEPDIQTVEGFSNGYSHITFNGYGKPIEGGGASTTATADPAFRDAVAWAFDLPLLVDRVLAGHGVPGTTLIPPYHDRWHVPPAPDKLRTFDLAKADEKLVAAGYVKNDQGERLDKEGKPLKLRLTWPASEPELATVAQFVTGWFAELGISVTAAVTEDDTLTNDLLPPEAEGKADFDMYMWGWVGDPDPSSLLSWFVTDAIASGNSDTFYSNPRFDELYQQQKSEVDETKRRAMLQEMQELFYADAPNIPLYYDSELHAYRTDKFTNWVRQPPDKGTPLFGYGPIGYTLLKDKSAEPSPSPEAPSAAPGESPAATPVPSEGGTDSGGDTMPLLIGAALVAGLAVVVVLLVRGRKAGSADEPE